MDCQYVATQRGGVALVFEGHRYNKVRDGKDGTVYWRCSRDRQCPGRAVTVNHRVKKANNKHNHAPESSLRNGSTSSHSTTSTATTTLNSNSNNNNSSHNANSHNTLNNSPSLASVSAASLMGVATPIAHTEAPIRLPSSHLSIQDVFDAQTAAAASFPASFMTEVAKYLASCASGNPHMAAAFASSMASLTPSLKNLTNPGRSPPISIAPFIPEGANRCSCTFVFNLLVVIVVVEVEVEVVF